MDAWEWVLVLVWWDTVKYCTGEFFERLDESYEVQIGWSQTSCVDSRWTVEDTWSQIFVFTRQKIWGRICRVLGWPWCGVLRSHWHTVTVTRIRLLYKCHIITTCDMISSYSLSTVLGNIICWDFWEVELGTHVYLRVWTKLSSMFDHWIEVSHSLEANPVRPWRGGAWQSTGLRSLTEEARGGVHSWT